ncbi:MAG: pyruvate, phosphate dikinase/phosphoenolpyruvate synthase regulator [Gammaproteobacteria bacterium]|nr:pyruvate, phosphate dikinase/phosphoenolpyruvate synthase regulator [Gammaproteobacteria bacterium]NIM73809.1 pyruvate, phosphate dikinase/phosphoenolpyruvate synthase regulator [Gammaproteobacteria bacterium]NIN39386.1 pyruvate, phosphate dikinase/phosphoenolpyruvate synthase regulator [Gammaproteobacteria bacterium]NIO25051.1 pyruvate, phosphate dikinase/phosphoenolpyruvate synthase regulator [Gammaproteobacteria bacterium]NIO65683.1 pyruvate, phosphate dikinase/phosphoenolpyruvate synthas
MKRSIFFVSDSTGITAETLGHALLSQFEALEYDQTTIPFVVGETEARAAVRRIDDAAEAGAGRPIVFSTLVNPDLNEILRESDALVVDFFSAFVRPLEIEFNRGSSHATGRFHGLVDRASYDGRIDAMDYALDHDDGGGIRHYHDADVVLVGVSRSGKTPTCVYLALQFGIRAANYPLTEEDLDAGNLPDMLAPHRERLFGLTIVPERLRQIRSERRPNSRYASLNRCRKEVADAESIFRREGVRFIDTSGSSIEEIASKILQSTGLTRRAF